MRGDAAKELARSLGIAVFFRRRRWFLRGMHLYMASPHLASDEAKLSPDIPRGLLSPTSSATGIINPARDLHSWAPTKAVFGTIQSKCFDHI